MEARDRWNERYAQPGRPWMPEEPSEWLVGHSSLLAGGGRALDVACGDGRNALYLAQLGYMVDAIDVSDVAVDALRAATEARGLTMTITPRVVDLEREPLPTGPYDVIVVTNFLQRDLFEPLQDALAPGGLLVFETLARCHVDELGHSFNPAYLVAPGELAGAFGRLEVVDHHEGVAERSGQPRGVAGIVARKPSIGGGAPAR
ncbi:MAG TPA: methyltransferase domain-containing protein [Solirubrobacteraceae bacterium]|nr:methyltransferase domain-containing protein [Solirubrobacteraceae bacterium]